jgi:hypothetical protein
MIVVTFVIIHRTQKMLSNTLLTKMRRDVTDRIWRHHSIHWPHLCFALTYRFSAFRLNFPKSIAMKHSRSEMTPKSISLHPFHTIVQIRDVVLNIRICQNMRILQNCKRGIRHVINRKWLSQLIHWPRPPNWLFMASSHLVYYYFIALSLGGVLDQK